MGDWKISKAVCSSLALNVLDLFKKGNLLCTSNECRLVLPCLNHVAVLWLSTSEEEMLIFFSPGCSLNYSSSSEVSRHPTTLQMLILSTDTRLSAKKGRSSFRGRLLTQTNFVTKFWPFKWEAESKHWSLGSQSPISSCSFFSSSSIFYFFLTSRNRTVKSQWPSSMQSNCVLLPEIVSLLC